MDSIVNDSIAYNIVGDGKVEFTAKITEAWKTVTYSRIANRILMEIGNFRAENFRELEKKAGEIPWDLYLGERTAFGLQTKDERYLSSNSELVNSYSIYIHVTCKHSRLYHSDAVAERLYKILDKGVSLPHHLKVAMYTKQQVAKCPKVAETPAGSSATPSAEIPCNAPKSEKAPPPQNLYVTLIDDRCTLWLDLAGEELYRRGHDRFVNEAPLKETIAAAMLFEATALAVAPFTLIDPMAGSGTFSLEAAYIANKLIPGLCRDFALKHQPAFKESTWNFIVNERNKDNIAGETRQSVCKIITSDVSERAIEIVKHNVESSPLAAVAPNAIAPKVRDFFSYTAQEIAVLCEASAPVLMLNPPYGKRLDCDAPKLYTKIGRKLSELSRDLKKVGKPLTVAILTPKDDFRSGYTCTANLLRECPALSPEHNPSAKQIITSHGGLSLNVLIAQI